MVNKVALLTAGGFAPCLSSAIGGLIERYTEVAPDVEIIAYRYGYQGLLQGDSITVTPAVREKAALLHQFGGSPIGNSRVKLTNAADLVKRGLVAEGVDPLQAAADRLTADGVDVLHTIGGDDTNTTAADLAAFLAKNDYALTVVGLPKTIDNDVIPIRQSLGAWTAAEQGARFAENIIGEHNSGSRMLIVHEVMGRHCGWLTAATAQAYRDWLDTREWLPEIGLSREAWEVHGVYVPGGGLRPGGRGRPAEEGDGRGRFGQPVPLRGRRPGHHRRRAGEVRRGGRPGSVRSRQDRQGQSGRLVRQQVRRAARRAEGDGAEVGLLLPFRRGQRPRPGADQVDDRLRRRLRAARRARA